MAARQGRAEGEHGMSLWHQVTMFAPVPVVSRARRRDRADLIAAQMSFLAGLNAYVTAEPAGRVVAVYRDGQPLPQGHLPRRPAPARPRNAEGALA